VPLLGKNPTIARNGNIVWRDGKPAAGVTAHRTGDGVAFAQGAGTATYAWTVG
jgi:hypothetical protein